MSDEIQQLLEKRVAEIPRVHTAVVVTDDGILRYWTGLDHLPPSQGPATIREKQQEAAEHRAAMVSGIATLVSQLAEQDQAGPARRTLIEAEGGWTVIGRAGERSFLALSVGPEADVAQLGYQLSLLAARLGEALDAERRRPRDES